MIYRKHIDVAARHTFSILSFAISRDPLSDDELFAIVEVIYLTADYHRPNLRKSLKVVDWKTITFEYVKLSYREFYYKKPCLWDIRKFFIDRSDDDNFFPAITRVTKVAA